MAGDPCTPNPLLTTTVAGLACRAVPCGPQETQLGVVTHDGAAYLKAPTTDAGTGPDSFIQGVFRSFNEPTYSTRALRNYHTLGLQLPLLWKRRKWRQRRLHGRPQ